MRSQIQPGADRATVEVALKHATTLDSAVAHAWAAIERQVAAACGHDLVAPLRVELQEELHRALSYLLTPCAELARQSGALAREALSTALPAHPAAADFAEVEASRLFASFPVLARLWVTTISCWQARTVELFERLAVDRNALECTMFHNRAVGRLLRTAAGLSDPHHGGRTVIALRFEGGAVIYKPRTGNGEHEWQRVLRLVNAGGFRPKLRTVQVLTRTSYCWMEFVRRDSCRDVAGVRRFYRRAGALAAAAELLGAVDCHKGNLIAAGEHPVLVDVDALLHPASIARETPQFADRSTTQFFATPRRAGQLPVPASLAPRDRGAHVPRLNGRYMPARDFQADILAGFVSAWRALAGTAPRRKILQRLVERLERHPRRRIYRPTSSYAAIRDASITPSLMRDPEQRRRFLSDACATPVLPRAVSLREAEQLAALDIPYFTHRGAASRTRPPPAPPQELLNWIRETFRA